MKEIDNEEYQDALNSLLEKSGKRSKNPICILKSKRLFDICYKKAMNLI